jgi:uncharacterized protein (TIGR00369 family)
VTGIDEQPAQLDIETPDSIQIRFGIEFLEQNPGEATAVLSMPMSSFRNPFTDALTVGPLAILVDAASGIVNHYRRRADQWTVSSELSMEVSPESVVDLDGPAVASARALGPLGTSSLSICTLTCKGTVIGGGTVRSFFIPAEGVDAESRPEALSRTAETQVSDLMAVHVRSDEGPPVLAQRPDPNLNNAVGIMHGGVAAAALEFTASAAINPYPGGLLLRTASLRVNFLRPFLAGHDSRYEGTPLRVGRSTGVGDAHAIGDDGKVAITARLTAYR